MNCLHNITTISCIQFCVDYYNHLFVLYAQHVRKTHYLYAAGAAYCISLALMKNLHKYFRYVSLMHAHMSSCFSEYRITKQLKFNFAQIFPKSFWNFLKRLTCYCIADYLCGMQILLISSMYHEPVIFTDVANIHDIIPHDQHL